MAQRVVSVDVRLAIAVSRKVSGERVNVTALAAELGVSRQTFYELERRARDGGLAAAIEPRSRRPLRSPAQIEPALEDLIVLPRKELAEQGWDSGADSILYRLPARMAADPALAGHKAPSRAT